MVEKKFNSFNQLINSNKTESGFKAFEDFIRSTTVNSEESNKFNNEQISENSEIAEKLINELSKAPESIEKVDEFVTFNDIITKEPIDYNDFPNEPILSDEESITVDTGDSTDAYKIFKDKNDIFECQLSIEGASLSEAEARLVLDSETLNLIFYGNIEANGKCIVKLAKGIPLPEGTIGKIRLEIIIDDQFFIGWEDTFKITVSKKITAKVKEKKSVSVKF